MSYMTAPDLPSHACMRVLLAPTAGICDGMQVARPEFVLLWMTFLAIIYSDLQTGILAGVIFSVVYFAYRYSVVCAQLC